MNTNRARWLFALAAVGACGLAGLVAILVADNSTAGDLARIAGSVALFLCAVTVVMWLTLQWRRRLWQRGERPSRRGPGTGRSAARGRSNTPRSASIAPRTGHNGGNSEPAHEGDVSEPSLPDASSLGDAELCHAWRYSFTVLTKVDTAGRLRVVQQRQAYLDELQRRDPWGFARWLRSGARAAGDPSKFVLGARRAHEPSSGEPGGQAA